LDRKTVESYEEEVRKILGMRLKESRINAGFSQEEVNVKMGYKSSGSVSQHENGTRSPKIPDLQKLAKLYNVPITYFFKKEPEPDEFTNEEKQLIENFRKASNKNKEVAKSLLTPEEQDVLSFSS